MSERRGFGVSLGFLPLLAIVFITLKLCNVIDWSWWWVLSPLWGPFACVIAVGTLLVCAAAVVHAVKEAKK